MRFIVSTTSLLKGLQAAGGVVSSTAVLPILEDFLFDIKGNKLTVHATDLETSISTNINIESKENGRVAIPAKILIDTLKTLPEQPLFFSVDERNYTVEITSENGRYKLAGENPEDFPKIPTPEGGTEITINSSRLASAISRTLFAVSSDELRVAMTGVLFRISPEGMTFVSTDAQKLVRLLYRDLTFNKEAQFILPKKALNLLKNILPNNEESVVINFASNHAFFSFGNTLLTSRLIEASYPDYNSVIPLNNPNKLTINRLELQNALKRVSIFSNKTTHQAIFTITGSELKLSAQDLDFSNEANERLVCSYEGTDMEIAFHSRFLIEMLGVIDSGDVELELSTPMRPGVLRPADKSENEDLLMLIMPTMINA
ncbi:MAG: DNA polymerase III subunit beta [Chitinophagales bacterium]|nr:DNA polymerase III subunit beta [Chitinophagales bacterium]MDW8274391.1 DNA polymerase III subunit beta [Chitinophagales bacterium]